MDIVAQAAKCNFMTVGAHTYGQPLNIHTWRDHYPEDARLRIGRYCSISRGVMVFLGGNHCVSWISTYPFAALGWERAKRKLPEAIKAASKGDVVIGNDVWIGTDVTIMSGVTVGDGAVIGAKAVVASNIEPYGIAVGNPARVVRRRFNDAVIHWLLELKWWDWPDERVQRAADILSSNDVQALLDFVG